MRTDRVILRSFLTTLLAIALLFGTMLLILCFVFPASMMEITYDLGMNELSVKYAKRAYNRTDDVYYAAFATETAILLEDNAKIEECGLRLIADDTFVEYCVIRNEEIAKDNQGVAADKQVSISYEQYVYGQVTMAQYSQNKKTEALSTALASLNGAFPKNNAAALLFITASKQGDETVVSTLKTNLEGLRTANLSEADASYLEALLALSNS